ncbi:Ig-like domain-containing protein [Thiohalorhabdus sp.]|uniref:Ig-like domain-containing protein n=1 Tax=Thiohalorhabdus sp. TaxID=3094134 RepID=UPI002FC375D6
MVLSYSDLGSGVDPDTLSVTVDGDPAVTACDHGDGTATCTPENPLPEGRITLKATVADHAGNTSEAAEVAITVDANPPVITVDEPANGAYTNQPEATLRGTVTDNVSGVAEFTVGGNTVDLGPQHGFAHTKALPTDGEHSIALAAIDRAGNPTPAAPGPSSATRPPAAPDRRRDRGGCRRRHRHRHRRQGQC